MKKYIRSFNGIIFTPKELSRDLDTGLIITHKFGERQHVTIVAESDTLTGLIMPGDLVKYRGKIIEVEEVTMLDKMYSFKDTTEIYFPNGSHYVLVAAKDEDDGNKWKRISYHGNWEED